MKPSVSPPLAFIEPRPGSLFGVKKLDRQEHDRSAVMLRHRFESYRQVILGHVLGQGEEASLPRDARRRNRGA
jgi:hypothetical protein